jgi:hypothetical protein
MSVRQVACILAAGFLLALLAAPAPAAEVWGVQPSTGLIVRIDPSNAAVLGSFAAPAGLQPSHTQIGLSIAEGGTS